LELIDDVTGRLRKFHNQELYNIHPLLNIIRVTKSRGMGWTRSMFGSDDIRIKVWSENLNGRDHSEDLGAD